MVLKAKVDSLDGVDEKYHNLYEEKDGGYVLLPIEGMKPQTEFDTVHTALQKERNDHRATKATLTKEQQELATAKQSASDLQAIIDAGFKDDAAINKLVETKVTQQVAPLQRKLTEAETKLTEQAGVITTYQKKEVDNTIKRAIRTAAKKADVRDTAISDAEMVGSHVFELVDGNVVTKADIAGVTPGVDATVWLASIKDTKPHWFKESQGGGGGGGRGNAGSTNPWMKANWNITKQAETYRENPTRAEQMAKAAGSSIGATKPPK